MPSIKNFFFKNISSKQTVVKNTVWMFAGEIGVRLCKLIVFIYAARVLGVSAWGEFSYVIALMASFALLSDIGINAVLTKETVRSSTTEYIQTGFVLKLFLSLLASTFFLVVAIFLKNGSQLHILIPVAALVLFLDSMREFGFSLNRAYEKMEIEAMNKLLAAILLVACSFIFIEYQKSAISLLWAYCISSGVGLIVVFVSVKKELRNVVGRFKKKLLKPLLLEAFPLALISVFGIILTNIDTIILGWFSTSTIVGLYAVAQKLTQLLYLIPLIIGTVLLPLLSRNAPNNERIKDIVGTTTSVALIISTLLGAAAVLFAQPVTVLLFGTAYQSASTAFSILSIAILVSGPGAIMSSALFAFGKQKKAVRAMVIGLGVDLITCFALIPSYGMYGAALAATIGQYVVNILLFFEVRTIVRFKLDIRKLPKLLRF